MLLLAITGRLTRALEGQLRREHLAARTRHVIAQDRVDRLAATTGWQPPRGVSPGNPPPPGAADVIPRGGRDAPR